MKKLAQISYEEYTGSDELALEDRALVEAARDAVKKAYAPYSKFCVEAAIRLSTGEIITGSNQENASSPVCVCAEHSALLTASSQQKELLIESIAVSYHNKLSEISDKPIAPCGQCRQFMSEFESRANRTIRVIMSGQVGVIKIVNSIADLLPFSFGTVDMKEQSL